MTSHRLAMLPGVTHYDINVAPALSAAVIPFIDGAQELVSVGSGRKGATCWI
jgi:hypothetical protein